MICSLCPEVALRITTSGVPFCPNHRLEADREQAKAAELSGYRIQRGLCTRCGAQLKTETCDNCGKTPAFQTRRGH